MTQQEIAEHLRFLAHSQGERPGHQFLLLAADWLFCRLREEQAIYRDTLAAIEAAMNEVGMSPLAESREIDWQNPDYLAEMFRRWREGQS